MSIMGVHQRTLKGFGNFCICSKCEGAPLLALREYGMEWQAQHESEAAGSIYLLHRKKQNKMAVVANDAAEILAEALGKMDDLINISEDQLFMEGLKKQQMSVAPDERVQSLLNELKSIVERIEPARNIAVPSATASVLIQWLELTQVLFNWWLSFRCVISARR